MDRVNHGILQGQPVHVHIVSSDPAVHYLVKKTLRFSDLRIIKYPASSPVRNRPYSKSAVWLVDVATQAAAAKGLIALLNSKMPDVRKIIIGDLSLDEMCEFLLFGVRGFLRCSEIPHTLQRAILLVANGRLYAPRDLLERYIQYSMSHSRPESLDDKPLTLRQKQILELLKQRNSNKEISSALAISENTVKFHLSRLFSKLGVHDHNAVLDALSYFAEIPNNGITFGVPTTFHTAKKQPHGSPMPTRNNY
ncbi:MAG TPA: response regulator transcription factor [Candidatus Acidoferrales bacterium]|nr:response regulator transcription factor [Candidatus Acidoferrales bacterium]